MALLTKKEAQATMPGLNKLRVKLQALAAEAAALGQQAASAYNSWEATRHAFSTGNLRGEGRGITPEDIRRQRDQSDELGAAQARVAAQHRGLSHLIAVLENLERVTTGAQGALAQFRREHPGLAEEVL